MNNPIIQRELIGTLRTPRAWMLMLAMVIGLATLRQVNPDRRPKV